MPSLPSHFEEVTELWSYWLQWQKIEKIPDYRGFYGKVGDGSAQTQRCVWDNVQLGFAGLRG